MAGGHLNVIFHGVFAFIFTNECIEVLVPVFNNQELWIDDSVKPKQITTAGQGYTYSLSGVKMGDSVTHFSKKETPVLQGVRAINRGLNVLFCSFYLPHPRQLQIARKVQIKDLGFLDGSSAKDLEAERGYKTFCVRSVLRE